MVKTSDKKRRRTQDQLKNSSTLKNGFKDKLNNNEIDLQQINKIVFKQLS